MIMKHLQVHSTDYKTLDDHFLASLVLLIEKMFVAAQKKQISWSIVDGFFVVLQFSLKIIRKDLFQSEQV